jgi:hypothetical protein
MKKTIFTVAVPMQDQTQCDRMKAVCLENWLPIWVDEYAFKLNDEFEVFGCSGGEFFIFDLFPEDTYTQVTETEFLELLKEYKDGTQNS